MGSVAWNSGFVVGAIGLLLAVFSDKDAGVLIFLTGFFVSIGGAIKMAFEMKGVEPRTWKIQLLMASGFGIAAIGFPLELYWSMDVVSQVLFYFGAFLMLLGIIWSWYNQLTRKGGDA